MQMTDIELAQLSDSPTFIRMLENKIRVEFTSSLGELRNDGASARDKLYSLVTEAFDSIDHPLDGLVHVSSATTSDNMHAKLTAMFSEKSDRILFEESLLEVKLKNPV